MGDTDEVVLPRRRRQRARIVLSDGSDEEEPVVKRAHVQLADCGRRRGRSSMGAASSAGGGLAASPSRPRQDVISGAALESPPVRRARVAGGRSSPD